MSTGGEKGSATTKTPADFLKSIRGRPVVVKLNSGVDYRGWSFVKLLYFCQFCDGFSQCCMFLCSFSCFSFNGGIHYYVNDSLRGLKLKFLIQRTKCDFCLEFLHDDS